MTGFRTAWTRLSLVLTACCLMAAGLTQADPVLLRYNYTEGNVTRYTVTTDEEVRQSPPNMGDMTMKSHTEMDLTQEVKRVDANGNALVAVTYDAIRAETSTPFGNISFDSSDAEQASSPELLGYQAILGLCVEMDLSPRGEILQVHGLDKLIDRVVNSIAGDAEPMKPLIEGMLSKLLSEDAINNNMSKLAPTFPENAVEAGAEWAQVLSIDPGFGNIDLNLVYTLASADASEISLDLRGSLTSSMNGDSLDMPLEYSLDGVLKGTVVLDSTTGLVQSTIMTHDMIGQVIIPESDMLPEGMAWDIAMSSTTTVAQL